MPSTAIPAFNPEFDVLLDQRVAYVLGLRA